MASKSGEEPSEENTALVVNFSTEPTNLKSFKQELLNQVETTIISNGEHLNIKFDNKYYRADVKLLIYPVTNKNEKLGIKKVIDQILRVVPSAQAIIVIIDDNTQSWSLLQEMWSDKISQESNADVQLALVFGSDSNLSNNDNTNFLWTVREHFEYIPMNIQDGCDSDGESILKDKFGIPRMLEALQTHVWINIKMKDNSSPRIPNVTDTTKLPQNGSDNFDLKSADKIDSLLDEMSIESELNKEDDNSFEKLFGSIMEMRKKAADMEGDERKDYAEKIVNLFMNAIPNSDDD
eukprot:TRINITY_DN2668_c0_g1_i2.p1 TRINITY_DN2668_c0_g1~~TRINITY_DN2668_c0_g1_i2.p1  ORF type:complete len:293 (+),score=76.03 TRINITY_DN2668_c0_g1_i2:48-926(+)